MSLETGLIVSGVIVFALILWCCLGCKCEGDGGGGSFSFGDD